MTPGATARIGLATVLALTVAACGTESRPGEGSAAGVGLQPTATIEEIMLYLVDPSADAIWESVVTDVTAGGVIEHVPETDEDWQTLRGHALRLIESTQLLLTPGRPVAAPGSRSEMPGVDLEPEQIEALLAEDRTAWSAFVGGLNTAGLAVLAAVDAHNADQLLVAGDGLDLACENCHLRYWYPTLSEPDTPR